MLDVQILSPQQLLFGGRVASIVLPGEQGVFEVASLHRPIVSRLLPGLILIEGQALRIRRGVVKVWQDTVVAIVEPIAAQASAR